MISNGSLPGVRVAPTTLNSRLAMAPKMPNMKPVVA